MASASDSSPPVAPVGEPRDRVDGRAKVTGRVVYAAEAPVRNAVHAVLVSSTIARGEITAMDAASVERSPGVLAVLTPKKHAKLEYVDAKFHAEKRLPLGDLRIYYAGQHIAVVVADTLERALYASTLLRVSYREEPPVLGLGDPAAKIEWPKGEMTGPLQLKKAMSTRR